GHHVGDADASTGPEHTVDLVEHRALVRREVDHAVRDDDVNGVIGERYLFDVAFDELHVGRAGLGGVAAGEVEHLLGHVEAIDEACRAHAARGEEDIDASTGAEVQDGLTNLQVGYGGRVAATKAGLSRCAWQGREIRDVVRACRQVGVERWVATAARCGATARRCRGCLGIALSDLLSELRTFHGWPPRTASVRVSLACRIDDCQYDYCSPAGSSAPSSATTAGR